MPAKATRARDTGFAGPNANVVPATAANRARVNHGKSLKIPVKPMFRITAARKTKQEKMALITQLNSLRARR
jgi:Fe-S cluster assembly scaffold protein SufB